MAKRSASVAFSDDDQVHIKLATEAEPLVAHLSVVRFFCSCGRGLPADADAWDLTCLLIGGQPVTKSVVVAWLNAAYRQAYASDFEHQEESPSNSATGLYELLIFADAVGSTKAVLLACLRELDGLKLHAQLGQQQLQVETDGKAYYFRQLQLRQCSLTAKQNLGLPVGVEQADAFIKQLVAQTEQLLYLAYKLQLEPLIDRLQAFVRYNNQYNSSLFDSQVDTLFSPRVLEAALGSNQLGKEAWINNIVTERCCFSKLHHTKRLLKPINLTSEQKQPIEFEAELQRNFMGTPKGTVVAVRLDMLSGRTESIKLGNAAALGVKLLIAAEEL